MKIILYGNSDKNEKTGFPSEADFINYIKGTVFTKHHGRYQYSQLHSADIILLSREGNAYGYFVISGTEEPNAKDREIAKSPRKVYLVKESVAFEKPVSLKSLGITGYQFGKTLTEEQFEQIKGLAGKKTINMGFPSRFLK